MGEINIIWLAQTSDVFIKAIDNKFNKPKQINSRINVFNR